MYATPQIENVGTASVLIQGNLGHIGEAGVSGHTKAPMLTPEEE
jgi:hypothetical protein